MVLHLKKYFLLYTLVPLLILTVAASYFRFMVSYDYLVSYEGDCDAFSQSCFLYCEDDECTEPLYYSIIERDASALRSICGANADILNCEAASTCQPNDRSCSVTYCDATIDDNCEYVQPTNGAVKISDS
jgi:hypothetical protein